MEEAGGNWSKARISTGRKQDKELRWRAIRGSSIRLGEKCGLVRSASASKRSYSLSRHLSGAVLGTFRILSFG